MHELIESYLAALAREEGYSENTVAAYRNDLGQLAEWLGSGPTPRVAWPQVTSADLQSYLFHMRDLAYAPSTMARKLAAIRSFFNQLGEMGIIRDNPTDELRPPRVRKGAPQALSHEALERLMAAPARHPNAKGQRDRAMLELLYATGIRVSELIRLTVEDLDREGARLSCGSGANRRTVPVGPSALGALAAYLDEGRAQLARSGEGPMLFLNTRGDPLTRQGLWLIIKQYVDSAGITDEVTPQMLRHSFAIHRLRAGADLHEVKELLGHINISTTQVYTHSADEPR